MPFSISSPGSFDKTMRALRKMEKTKLSSIIERQAEAGVRALHQATPKDSGLSAESWGYEIRESASKLVIEWTNLDIENGFPVAVMIQYGHGTGTGGWVQGVDYINPAMRPIFDQIAETLWKAVTSA